MALRKMSRPGEGALASAKEVAPGRRGRGRPVGDRDAKRDALLKAATEVIAAEGYGGVSLRKVAQKAGCTTGQVNYYLENKDHMVAAVAERLFDEWDRMRARSGHEEGLRRFLDWASSGDSAEWSAALELAIHARRVPAFAAVYQRRYGAYRKALTRAMAKSQREGVVRGDIPADILTDQICALADGLMMAIPNDRRHFTPARINALIELTMALIRPPSA